VSRRRDRVPIIIDVSGIQDLKLRQLPEVKHVEPQELRPYAKTRLRRGGLRRRDPSRGVGSQKRLLKKVPAGRRMKGKDVSHIKPYKHYGRAGGTTNIIGFEHKHLNGPRGAKDLTDLEIRRFNLQHHKDNVMGAVDLGKNLAVGAAVGAAVFEGVFSAAENLTAYAKGDKSAGDAVVDAGAAVVQAASSAVAVTAVLATAAAAAPVFATALAAAAPAMAMYGSYCVVERTLKLWRYACTS